MDRGAWWATVGGGRKESDMTEVTKHTTSPRRRLGALPQAKPLSHGRHLLKVGASSFGETKQEGDDEGLVPARVRDRAGSAALREKGARNQKPESREPGSETTSGLGVQALREGQVTGLRPGLPPCFFHTHTYRPNPARQRCRLSHGWPPRRPWKRLPAGTTSVKAAPSLAVSTEAAADWLAVPATAERSWVSGRRPADPPEDRELPVRVVSGGPGAGGDCDLAAAGGLPAPSRVSVSLYLRFLPSAQCPGRSSLLIPDDPHLSL